MSAASESISIQMMPDTVYGNCRQCGKPAKTWVGIDAEPQLMLCLPHTALAVEHFTNTHRITR